jgi:beta-1,4-N-acetylglucosaminyltransferase
LNPAPDASRVPRSLRPTRRSQRQPSGRRRILLVCSSGGHLTQLHALRPWWEGHDRVWVTFRKPDSESILMGERVVWAHHPTTRNVVNLIRNLMLSWRLLLRYRPHLVVSTGAGVAFPFFLVARVLGKGTVYVEVYDRIQSATLTGRLCYPLSNLFLLQWEEQKSLYPNGVVIGALL